MLPSHAIEQAGVIHLFGLNFSAKTTDLEKLIVDLGYPNCLYYWPDLERGSSHNHKGWCRVVFVTKETAEKAKIDLSTSSLLGRPINIGTITKHAVSFFHPSVFVIIPTRSSLPPEHHRCSLRRSLHILWWKPSTILRWQPRFPKPCAFINTQMSGITIPRTPTSTLLHTCPG